MRIDLTNPFARAKLCKIKRTMNANTDPVYQTGYRDGFEARSRQPVPGVMTLGKLTLQRLPSGQLILTDGVSGTSPNEEQLEQVLRHVFENRWKSAAEMQSNVVVYES